jgi:cob(I)alamin adenosyltransferase
VRSALLAGALAVPALIAGCGGDDDGGGELSTGDVTKQEYIAQAEETCDQANEEFEAATENLDDPSREEIVNAIEEDIVPITRNLLDDLRALEAPSSEVDELTTLYDQFEEELEALEADPENFAGRSNPFEETSAAFSDFGLSACV